MSRSPSASDMDRTEYTGLAVALTSIAVARLSGVSWWWVIGAVAALFVGLIGWAIWMHLNTRE
ncbi:MAG: hypothetical protein ABNH26_08525 [Celeribacter sp.]